MPRRPRHSNQNIFSKLNTTVEEVNFEPTICGKKWLGNSHMGKIKGIKKNPNNYIHEVLRQDEIDYINACVQTRI